MSLEGKVCRLVTGASRGIGLGHRHAWAKAPLSLVPATSDSGANPPSADNSRKRVHWHSAAYKLMCGIRRHCRVLGRLPALRRPSILVNNGGYHRR